MQFAPGNYKIPLIRFAVGLVLFAFLYRIRDLLLPFFMAGIVAYMMMPLVEYIVVKFKINRVLVILFWYILVFGTAGAVLAYLIPVTVGQIFRFVETLPAYTMQIQRFIGTLEVTYERIILPQNLRMIIDQQITQGELFLVETANTLIERFFGLYRYLISVLITPVFAFYILKDTQQIKNGFYGLFSKQGKIKAQEVVTDLHRVLRQFFRGQFIICVILSFIYSLSFAFIGVRYATVLGLFAGFANIVPYLGPMLGTLAPMTIASFVSWELSLAVLFLSFVIQQTGQQLLNPLIIGRRFDPHPLIVILAVLTGARFFGFFGILLAIPFTSTLRVLIRHFLRPEHLQLF